MNFEEAQVRLIARVRDRIQNGELTERGFARSVGISQAHIHNVLKGIRSLSIKMSDLILNESAYSMLDLFSIDEISKELARLSAHSTPMFDLPFLADRLGPGMPWPSHINWRDQYPVPCAIASSPGLIMARLAYDCEMNYASLGFDIVVLEGMENALKPEAVYAIDRGGDTLLRRVRPGLNSLYLVADAHLDRPAAWEPVGLPLPSGFFRGCVRWWGRERTGKPARQV